MKSITVISILIAIFICSCAKDNSVEPINNLENLISNDSFETSASLPDYNGWNGTIFLADDSGEQNPPLVQDAPETGGIWSVQLEPLWFPSEGYTETIITEQQVGTNIYEISAWIKAPNWPGSVSFEHWRNGQRIKVKTFTETSDFWKQISFMDTLATISTDTLKIRLSAGGTEVASGKVLFDVVNVSLMK